MPTSVARRAVAGPLLVAGLSAGVMSLAFVLGGLSDLDLTVPLAIGLPAVLVPAAVGGFIGIRRPGNRVAWVLVLDALVIALALLAHTWAEYALIASPGALPGGRWALLWDQVLWPSFFAGPAALAFVFPDGRLPSPRWRPVAIAAAAAFCLTLALGVGTEELPARFGVERPLPALPSAFDALRGVGALAVLASLVAAAAAVAVRLRRARGVERLQLLWLAYGALLLPIAIVVCLVAGAIAGGAEDELPVLAATLAAATALPLGAGIALLRHRLFDIELVLSRTLRYATLTAILAGLCIAIVVGLDAFLHARGVASAVAAIAAALAIQPLRGPLQRRVDRLVYGDRSDPYAALARLGRRLQDAPATTEVLPAIVGSVDEALRPAYTAIELERDGRLEVAAARGRPGREPATAIPLVSHGEAVGRLVVEPRAGGPISAADLRLLRDLAGQAGVAAHAVRLTADLQRSRERLVTAREEERRRLRRDLHDGIGPTLATMVLGLGAAGRAVRERSEAAEPLLDELRGQTKDAIGEIRRLVDGLGSAALDELGLLEALRVQAARVVERGGPEAEVLGPGTLPELPAAVEVAAYRIASEALTNVTRHAAATRCAVRLSAADALVVTIEDDGVGLTAHDPPGVGLRSMRERAAELGGSLEVGPARHGGTVVRAELPLGAG
jgi:signal transduction histidine kinase